MLKQNKKTLIKVLLYIPLIWLVYVLQSMIFPHLPLLGAMPLLLPVLVIGTALFEGCVYGGSVGLVCGILCDLSFNQPAVQFTLVLTFIGIAVGLLSDSILARGFPSYYLCCFCGLLLCGFCQAFDFFSSETSRAAIANTLLCQTFYSLLLAFPMYFLVRFVGRTPKS